MKTSFISLTLFTLALATHVNIYASTTADDEPEIVVPVADFQYVTTPTGNYAPLPTQGELQLYGGTSFQHSQLTINVLSDNGSPIIYDADTQTLKIEKEGTRLSFQCSSPTTGMTYALVRVMIEETAEGHTGWDEAYVVPFIEENGYEPVSLIEGTYTYQWSAVSATQDVIQLSMTTEGDANFIKTIAIDFTDITIPEPIIKGPVFGFTGTQTVSLSSPIGGRIFYTTDGSTPTVGSTPYRTPFSISQTTTVKAVTYISGYLSDVATHTFYDKAVATGVDRVGTDVHSVTAEYYTPYGLRISHPDVYRGIVIVKQSDGATIKKVI